MSDGFFERWGQNNFKRQKWPNQKLKPLFAADFGQVLGELAQQTHTSI
jgi:hypothetical protein